MIFRNVCFTLNNPKLDDKEKLLSLGIWRYVIIGDEVGETGTPHLQGYGILHKQWRLNALKKEVGDRVHLERRKGTHEQAREYCMKDDHYEERGTEPTPGKRNDLEKAIDCIKATGSLKRVAEDCPSTFIKYSRGLRDYALMMVEPYDHFSVRGLWYVGEPGTGKSRKAREIYPDAYLKSQNKWFDGYDGQTAIILDDLDKGGACLGHFLKIWTDRYACTGETKGGTVALRHEVFVVTSNYSIDELWGEDLQMCAAIKRRFIIRQFPEVEY